MKKWFLISIIAASLSACTATKQDTSSSNAGKTRVAGNIFFKKLAPIGGGYEAEGTFTGRAVSVSIRRVDENSRPGAAKDRSGHLNAAKGFAVREGCGNATLDNERSASAPKYFWAFNFKCG